MFDKRSSWAIPPVRLGLSGRNSGKIPEFLPETLSERFLEFPSRVRLGCPKPYNSRHLRLPERFQNSLPPSTAGDASFFRIGSGEGLSELVMEFPAVLGVLLTSSLSALSGTSVWRTQSRYTMSCIECRIKFPQNQRCRAKIAVHPPQIKVSHLSLDPPVALPLIHSRQGARWAGGGYRGTFGFRKRIALPGGVAATVTPVALLRATKCQPIPLNFGGDHFTP